MMSQNSFTITEADRSILIALARFHYLTADQITRLLYPKLQDENRYSQRRLKRLADANYALRLRALPTPRYGQAPHVFTLGQKGRSHVKALGLPIAQYFRPSEEAKAVENSPFMYHTLAAIDVLISASCLGRDHGVSTLRMLSERDLKRDKVLVEVPPNPKAHGGASSTAPVIPDGWFELQEPGGPAIAIALELDRGTESQRTWRHKAAALAYWAAGPYREAFQATNLTIIVVCPDEKRRDELADWTATELEERSFAGLADIFLFTSVDPAEVSSAAFFFAPCWRSATSLESVSVLDPPPESEVVPIRV